MPMNFNFRYMTDTSEMPLGSQTWLGARGLSQTYSLKRMIQARIQGGGRWGGRPPLGRKDPRRRRGFPRLKGRKKGHWCLLNGFSTQFRHNMAINILKSCKSVFAYVKNRSFPSHIRSSFPWRPPLAEILDPSLWSMGAVGATTLHPQYSVNGCRHQQYSGTKQPFHER